jgi:pyrroline-5-carboxylate reductase
MKIAILGCGNMGRGLAERLSPFHEMILFDRHPEKVKTLVHAGFGKGIADMQVAIEGAEVVILAVKPQSLDEVAATIGKDLKEDQHLVSLLVGTPIEALKDAFPHGKIVRMMPNLALIHGQGVIGLAAEESVDTKRFDALFAPLGKCYWIPEKKIEAIASLAGSGPAFFCVILEAMVDAGIAMGFSAPLAKELACQMVRGTLTLLETTHKNTAELRWQTSSPEGTTIAGILALEEGALRATIMNTFLASYDRAFEIQKAARTKK